jgi:CRISPR-associated Csx10 family RAMP protein
MPAKTLELYLTFDGPFNVGAGALGGSLADKPLTRDARGLPMVPASTFKGRLRHEVERLAPVFYPNEPPCNSPVPETMCQGDAAPCPVCRLFGSPWRPGKLTFTDLTLAEPGFLKAADPVPGTLRYGVGLSRQRRVAEDHLLYTTEVFMPGTPVTLRGTITGELDEQELALLRAGLDGLYALGGGKTKGLGWFDLQVRIQDEAESDLTPARAAPSQDKYLDIVITLESPLLIGTDASEAYYNPTRPYVPGSVLRGSLARRVLETCSHSRNGPHDGCEFDRVFGVEPVFEHLYPTTGAREFAFPAPLTARSCKYHSGFATTRNTDDKGHGVGDILVRQVVFEQMLERPLALPALYQPRCPECRSEVESFREFVVMAAPDVFDAVSIPVRRTSRTAINRQRAVAADGQLYTLEIVEPQDEQRRRTMFRGRVWAAPEQLERLQSWLQRLTSIGRKQSSGLGQIKIEVRKPGELVDPLPSLDKRIESFNAKLREEWAFYERIARVEPLPDNVCFFTLDLLSPAILTRNNLPITSVPPEMLGFEAGVKLLRAFASHQMMGGWHLGAGLPRRTQLAVDMGSVFLYRCEGYTPEQLASRLHDFEENGIGSDRPRGMGRVLVCLPFHYQPEVML